jgi:Cu(I)/Ag(I) efflux system membrane protein CusA/SilA
MVGGMVTAPLLSMFVVPAIYRLMRRRGRLTLGEAPTDRSAVSAHNPSTSVV